MAYIYGRYQVWGGTWWNFDLMYYHPPLIITLHGGGVLLVVLPIPISILLHRMKWWKSDHCLGYWVIYLKFCMLVMVVLLTSTPWVLIMTLSPRQEVWNPLSLGVLPIQVDSSPLPPSPEPPPIPMRWAFHSTQCCTLALPQEKVTQFQSQNTALGWIISVS